MQLRIVFFKKSIISDMRHRNTLIFSKVGLVNQSKSCTLFFLQKNDKLYKFATTNSNFEKINSFRHVSS